MSWRDIMQRVLPPNGAASPAITRAGSYGAREGRTPPSSIPHGGIDFNYPGGQTGINLTHPALRSPVSGIVTTKPRQGTVGKIAIRDKNGLSHELLHTHSQFLTPGDPVVAGQLIGTMGNTGAGDHHVHYQFKDSNGNILDPTAFWDEQGPVDPNPAPPAYTQEYQQYLRQLGVGTGDGFGNVPGAPHLAGKPLGLASSRPARSLVPGRPFWKLSLRSCTHRGANGRRSSGLVQQSPWKLGHHSGR
jgi:Peptidase family M23